VLAIKIIDSLFFGIIGLIPIDDLLEITPDPRLLHRFVFITPPAGGQQDVSQSRLFGLA